MQDAPLPENPHRLLPWLVAIGFFMQLLDASVVNVALPTMARALGESPLRLQGVVLVYLLMVALLTPASGWLADRYGTRTVFQSAIALFAFGAVLCAASSTLTQLLWARALQGIGGAMLMPVGRLAVLRAFPPSQLIRVLALMTLPGTLAPLTGPMLGGWLVQTLGWHAVFLLQLPVAVLGLAVTARWMPNLRASRVPFDGRGFALFGAGIVLLTWGMDGMGRGGASRGDLVGVALGTGALWLYFVHAARVPRPLFATELTRRPLFRLAVFGNLMARVSMGAMPFLLALFLQLGLGHSPMESGAAMIPVALGALASKALVERAIHRFGYRPVLVGNSLALGALTALFSLVGATTPLPLLVGLMVLFGVSTSLQFTAMNSLSLSDVQGEHASAGNSLYSVVVQVSMGLGVATGGMLLGLFGGVRGEGDHAQVMHSFHATFACLGLAGAAAALVFCRVQDSMGQREAGAVSR